MAWTPEAVFLKNLSILVCSALIDKSLYERLIMLKKMGIGISFCVMLMMCPIVAFDKTLIDFAISQELLEEYNKNNSQVPFEQAADEMVDFVQSLVDPKVEKYCCQAKNKNPDIMLLKRYVDLVALYAVFFGKSAAVILPLSSPERLDYIMTGNMAPLPENLTEEQVLALVTTMQEQMEQFMDAMEKLAATIGVKQLIDWEQWQEESDEELAEN